MLDGAVLAFRDQLRRELTVEEIVALLKETIASRWHPSFVDLRLDHDTTTPTFNPEDPLVGYALRHGETMTVAALDLVSPLLDEMRTAGATLIVPLLSQGALGGFIVFGQPSNQAELSVEDRQLLEELAAYGAAALRIAWLTHQHETSERAWESNAEELRIAQAIQRNLLPKDLPAIPGWEIAYHYQPARVVGGDLYDFIPLPGDLLGIVFGDASDKSVPAALSMATARTLLRASAQRLVLPAQVLERVNEVLASQLPPGTFVTCFFAILDPASGRLRYANAGQCTPFRYGTSGVSELRASGWPLGMMPNVTYDEAEITIGAGESILFYSDGLIETHAPNGEMFGVPHLRRALEGHSSRVRVIDDLRTEHAKFAGPEWDQEDDLTIVSIARLPSPFETLADFTLPSVNGTEREAVARIEESLVLAGLTLPERQLERLSTAVTETVMNGIEHGNKNRPEVPLGVQVLRSPSELRVRVTDQGPGLPEPSVERPNLAAKLAETEDPRGWGIFLTQQMVDEVIRTNTPSGYAVELVVRLAEQESVATSSATDVG
jgi:serine phosphatase RsbU (regulator of sigma subunit)/anti-sigma regulatory factor (Ser/Thr protein kinase)